MFMVTRPEAYPFLRISRQYGVPYENVLRAADDLKNFGRADFSGIQHIEYVIDIAHATEIQRMIRDGEIDWNTGEPVPTLQ